MDASFSILLTKYLQTPGSLILLLGIMAFIGVLIGMKWGTNKCHNEWKRQIDSYGSRLNRYLDTRFPKDRFDHGEQTEAMLPLTDAIIHMQRAYRDREISLLKQINSLQWKNQVITNRSRKYSRHLLWLVSHDPLTGLINRIRLLKFMERLIKRATPFAVIFIDLNEFRKINEQFGQAVGDLVLKEIAQRLQKSTDKKGVTAHLNSDDFSMITQIVDHDRLFPFLNHLIEIISHPIDLENHRVSVSPAVGVTIFPADQSGSETLLRHAEQAAYQAKHKALKLYHLFDVEEEERSRKFKLRYHEIETAFIKGEFEFHYQPKVNMLTGEILGAEALIRWNSPDRGMISPAEFIPVIENTDLIHKVGSWVITNAVLCLNEWKQSKLNNLILSINIAGLQILEGHLDKELHKIFRRYPAVSPRQLELEILETAALDDMETACKVLRRCRDLGCIIAMDDFGTGYSSLSYFRQLPLDVIKIDQEFVCNMLDDSDSQALIAVMISVGNLFSKKIIAEGVETEEHGQRLLEMGCEWGQGYAISRPLPEPEFTAWCRSWHPPTSWQAVSHYRSLH